MPIKKAGINKNPNGGVLPTRGVFRTTFGGKVIDINTYSWEATNRQDQETITTSIIDYFDHEVEQVETASTTKSFDINDGGGPPTIFNSPDGATYGNGVLTFPDNFQQSTSEITLGTIVNSVTRVLDTPFGTSTTQTVTVKPNSLTIATNAALDETGSVNIYSSSSPYVREINNIIPGVDLTCIPVTGRGILVAPDVVARAWHNRGSATGSYTFVASDGTEVTAQGQSFSPQLGGDLVYHKLSAPLPSSISPAKVPPADIENYFSSEIDTNSLGFRVEYTGGHRLTAGYSRFLSTRWDLDSRPDLPSFLWSEAISGDSGGAMFLVINSEVVAMATTWNTAEQGTSIHNHLTELQSLTTQTQTINLTNFPKGT